MEPSWPIDFGDDWKLQISSQRANKTEKILLEVIFQLTCSSTDIPWGTRSLKYFHMLEVSRQSWQHHTCHQVNNKNISQINQQHSLNFVHMNGLSCKLMDVCSMTVEYVKWCWGLYSWCLPTCVLHFLWPMRLISCIVTEGRWCRDFFWIYISDSVSAYWKFSVLPHRHCFFPDQVHGNCQVLDTTWLAYFCI